MMRKTYYFGIVFMILMLMTACGDNISDPETKDFASLQRENAVQVSGVFAANDFFSVKHQVKGRDVYLECIVKGASFRNNGAKILLYVDGKKTKEINNAAFIVKGLNKGTHKIKLELMETGKQTASAEKEIEVMIP